MASYPDFVPIVDYSSSSEYQNALSNYNSRMNVANGLSTIPLVGGFLSGLASSDAQQYKQQMSDIQNRISIENANAQNRFMYDLNKANFDFQQEQYEYEKGLQEQIFAREDNAVQRRALDLEKAGLSKTLAAGSGANAGAAVSVSAPQNEFNGAELSILSVLNDMYNNTRQTSSNMALNEAQVNLFNSQAEQQRLNNLFDSVFESSERAVSLGKNIADTQYIREGLLPEAKQKIMNLITQDVLNEYNIGHVQAQVDKIYSDIGINDKSKDLLDAQIRNYIANTVNVGSLTALNKEKLNLLFSQVALTNIQSELAKQSFYFNQENKEYYDYFGAPYSSSGTPLSSSTGGNVGLFGFRAGYNKKSPFLIGEKGFSEDEFILMKGLSDMNFYIHDPNMSNEEKNRYVSEWIDEYVKYFNSKNK